MMLSMFAWITHVQVLPLVEDNVWTLTFYNNLNASILLTICIVASSEAKNIENSQNVLTLKFWAEMMIAGVFGFAIGYVSGLQIKVQSNLYILLLHSEEMATFMA